jgi:hypothetical protein
MANSFNHSKLKKRITMMLKSKSNAWGRLKYLYVLPLVAITSVAFARPEISQELDKISSTKISELPLIKEVLPEKNELLASEEIPSNATVNPQKKTTQKQEEVPIQEGNIDKHIQKHVDELTKSVHEKVASEQAYVQSIVDNAIAEINSHKGEITPQQEAQLNNQVEQAVRESELRIEGYAGEQEKAMRKSLVIGLPADANIVIIIDGVRVSKEELSKLNPEDIEDVNIQKDSELISKYGKDIQGVIFVKTKK